MATDMSESGAATTVGGDVTELDAQSVAWFSAFCGGFKGIVDLQSQGSADLSSPAAAGQFFSTLGQTMTETGQRISGIAPPTFEGGDQLASTAQEVFNKLGPAFTTFGQQAATIDQNDQAAVQQFAAELQQQAAGLQDIQKIELSPSVQAAAEKQVPECAVLAQMGSSASSAAPTS